MDSYAVPLQVANELRYREHGAKFQHTTGAMLLQLDDNDLIDMGVTSAAHRKHLLHYIKELRDATDRTVSDDVNNSGNGGSIVPGREPALPKATPGIVDVAAPEPDSIEGGEPTPAVEYQSIAAQLKLAKDVALAPVVRQRE